MTLLNILISYLSQNNAEFSQLRGLKIKCYMVSSLQPSIPGKLLKSVFLGRTLLLTVSLSAFTGAVISQDSKDTCTFINGFHLIFR